MIGFCFFFVACEGAQLIISENKIPFSVTKQITACEVTVQVSVLTCKEMKEYERLYNFQFILIQTCLASKTLNASGNDVTLQTTCPS